METSKPVDGCQRPRVRCEPGQHDRLKILPELQAERRQVSKQAGLVPR